nr:CoA-binding protein [Paenibacillus turpanensis]
MFENPSRDEIKDMLKHAGVIAVVGLSDNPERPAFYVSEAMQKKGYRIIPVHPTAKEVLGQKVYPSLSDVPEPIDIVNVFVRSEMTPPVAEEAVQVKAKAIWLQQGVFSEEAARIAKDGGLQVVMDRCIKVEDSILLPNGRG